MLLNKKKNLYVYYAGLINKLNSYNKTKKIYEK